MFAQQLAGLNGIFNGFACCIRTKGETREQELVILRSLLLLIHLFPFLLKWMENLARNIAYSACEWFNYWLCSHRSLASTVVRLNRAQQTSKFNDQMSKFIKIQKPFRSHRIFKPSLLFKHPSEWAICHAKQNKIKCAKKNCQPP